MMVPPPKEEDDPVEPAGECCTEPEQDDGEELGDRLRIEDAPEGDFRCWYGEGGK